MDFFRIQINRNLEIWDLLDKNLPYVYISNFRPLNSIEWSSIDLRIDEIQLKSLSTRSINLDIKMELREVKDVLKMNSNFLDLFQFESDIPDSLIPDRLPKDQKESILIQNGFKHKFELEFEQLTISSIDSAFINKIKTNYNNS